MIERKATAYAVTVEIHCPVCAQFNPGGQAPIPAHDGSFMWGELPEKVTCPECRQTFKVKKRIR